MHLSVEIDLAGKGTIRWTALTRSLGSRRNWQPQPRIFKVF